ncbi:MAG: AraC family transcriptional regulator [Bacillota bacterium]|nr:AraC family transcriptional regulator [Bacillota bacterium]
MQNQPNDLLERLTAAFAEAGGLGCLILDAAMEPLLRHGLACDGCPLARLLAFAPEYCRHARRFGQAEAKRFGGRYIYQCQAGLTAIANPVDLPPGAGTAAVGIVAGPLLLVEREDYLSSELAAVRDQEAAREAVVQIPVLTPERVNSLSTLLFLAAAFVQDRFVSELRLRDEVALETQGELTWLIQLLKPETPVPYPIATEQALLRAITRRDRQEARRLLNELLGVILLNGGYAMEQVHARMRELLVLVSRAAIAAGAPVERTLALANRCIEQLPGWPTVEAVSMGVGDMLRSSMELVFEHRDARHASVLHRVTQYVEAHCHENLRLADLARLCQLSPSYLSRIFKRETGVTLQQYINQVRVEKARSLLLGSDSRIVDIALALGFQDQSYFTKVFRRMTGQTPMQYRAGRLHRETEDERP